MKKVIIPFFLIFCVVSLKSQEKSDFPKTGQQSLEASRKAYGKGYYNLAQYYADLALKDSSVAERAAEIKIGCMEHLMKDSADSTKFIIAALELHRMDPKDLAFLKPLLDYYSSPGHISEMEDFIDDELRENPADKKIWALKGEMQMRKHRWDEAIGSYQQSVELDSSFVEAIYNVGICYSSKAMDLKDSLQDSHGRLDKNNKEKVLAVFECSKNYLEKARVLDPVYKTVDWRKALYQVYYILGEKKKAREVKSLL